MGSRIWRTILTPKLGIAVAVIIAFAVGAYLSGTYLNPFAQASHVAANSGPTSPHSVKARGTSSLKTKHAVKSKRTHSSKLKPKHKHKPTPKADPSPHPTTPAPSPPGHSSPGSPAPSSPPTSSSPAPKPVTSVVAGSVSCNYGPDTWSGDASKVGYSVKETEASNGNRSSFAVVLNANKGNTEVVGYPSVQCLTYSGLPKTLTASFDTAPPADSSGLDYEYAFDIWLTTASAATSNNWNNDLRVDDLDVRPRPGAARISEGNAERRREGLRVWRQHDRDCLGRPAQNVASGSVDIASIVSQLKADGYVTSADTGILDVEYGIEAPYGGGQTFKVNGFSVTAG